MGAAMQSGTLRSMPSREGSSSYAATLSYSWMRPPSTS
jgi:hypothetical protein